MTTINLIQYYERTYKTIENNTIHLWQTILL